MDIKVQLTKVQNLQKMSKTHLPRQHPDVLFESLCDVVLELLLEISNLKAEIQSIK